MRRRHSITTLDTRTLGEAVSHDGIDPRTWVSYGIVEKPIVEFSEEYGPVVTVRLQPDDILVGCRVAAFVAGNGEGAYFPFVEGDEVLVALPGGNTQGACIVGRMNNSIDKFPMDSVAGQDPTTNTFSFTRRRTPVIDEFAGLYVLRQATTEALLSFDSKGSVTLKDGNKNALQMSADLIGVQSGDAKYLMQLDLTGSRFTVQVNDSILTLSGSDASPYTGGIYTPGSFTVGVATNPPVEHVLTTEALANILSVWATAIGGAYAPIAAAMNPASVADAITAAATTPLLPNTGTAIAAVFAAPKVKPPAVTGQGQLMPGIGCASFLTG